MEKKEEKEERKRVFAWWWLLLLAILAGGAWYFLKGGGAVSSVPSINSEIRVCNEGKTMNLTQCCDTEQLQISIFETSNIFFVTAKFPGMTAQTPVITGAVHWSTGEKFPTQPIQLAPSSNPDGCFSGKVQPIHGTTWSLGKYTLKLQVNDQPAGEKEFEIVR